MTRNKVQPSQILPPGGQGERLYEAVQKVLGSYPFGVLYELLQHVQEKTLYRNLSPRERTLFAALATAYEKSAARGK